MIKTILTAVSNIESINIDEFEIDGLDKTELLKLLKMLLKSGYIYGKISEDITGNHMGRIEGLSMRGYTYLNS